MLGMLLKMLCPLLDLVCWVAYILILIMNQILILRALFHTVPMMTPGTKNLNQSFSPCAGDVVNRVDSCSVHPLHNSSAVTPKASVEP